METQPEVVTTVSSQSVCPGTQITDTVKVTGLNGESATVTAALYGPFATRAAIKCTGTAVVDGDDRRSRRRHVRDAAVHRQTPGYYTYHESIAASGFVRATRRPAPTPPRRRS